MELRTWRLVYGQTQQEKIMYYKEDKSFLHNKDKDYIEKVILGNQFPFFLMNDDVGTGEGNSWLSHTIVERKELRPKGYKVESPYYGFFLNMLESFAKKNDIPNGELLRCSINFTFPDKKDKSEIHQDHSFPHKQLIIYLNQPQDTNSKTVVLDEDKETILKEIVPEQFKGVCFENKPHYHYYPTSGYRAVCVYTFR